MEFSSSYISILDLVAIDREQLVVVFTFGAMGAFFVMLMFMVLLIKIKVHQFFINAFFVLTLTLFVSLLIGFVSQMLLLMSGVSGIKMILIWVLMFLMILSFIIYNYSVIDKKIKKNMNQS